jgi:hypothetical protein
MHADQFALLKSCLCIFALADVILLNKSSCALLNRSIWVSLLTGAPENAGSDLLHFRLSRIQEYEEFVHGRCYWNDAFLYGCTGPRCYKLQTWRLGWHWYILPCNQVLDTQQKSGCDIVDTNTTAHSMVEYIYCLWKHSDHIRAPVHWFCVPSPLHFVCIIAV